MADYYITKVKYNTEDTKIDIHYGFDKDGNAFELTNDQARQLLNGGSTLATVTRDTKGKWVHLNDIVLTKSEEGSS